MDDAALMFACGSRIADALVQGLAHALMRGMIVCGSLRDCAAAKIYGRDAASADGDDSAVVLLTDESAVGAAQCPAASCDVVFEWGQVQAIGRAVEHAMMVQVGGLEQGQPAGRTRCCVIM